MSGIKRRFVTVTGARQVHYRRMGEGPPFVLLHQSPRSSLELIDLAEALGRRFCVVAPDLPGYGGSDPLPGVEAPSIVDYTRATVEALDALGIERCAIYGLHTGASIAIELAHARPELAACLVLDGVPIFTEAERDACLAHYLPPLEPDADGTHLVGLWSRFRIQHVYFPWFDQRLETRLDVDMPDAWQLQDAVMDVLRAGPSYGAGYRAAWRHDPRPSLAALTVPAAILAREDDFLTPQASRLPALPPGVEVEPVPEDTAARAEWLAEYAARHLAGAPPASPPPAAACLADGLSRTYVDTSAGQLHVRGRWDGGGRPLVMLHASPGSARMLETLARELARSRPLLAFDTLGNGESDKPPGWERRGGTPAAAVRPWDAPEIADYAAVVVEALERLGVGEVDLYGSHTGGCIGIETAIRLGPERARGLVVDGVTLFTADEVADLLAHYTPPLEPSWDGSHLAFAWQFLRAQTQFWPWYRQTRAGIRRVDVVPPRPLHTWVVELLKSGHTYPLAYRAAFAYPTRERLPHLATRTLVCGVVDDMLAVHSEEAATLAPNAVAQVLPDRPPEQAAMIASFLDAASPW